MTVETTSTFFDSSTQTGKFTIFRCFFFFLYVGKIIFHKMTHILHNTIYVTITDLGIFF